MQCVIKSIPEHKVWWSNECKKKKIDISILHIVSQHDIIHIAWITDSFFSCTRLYIFLSTHVDHKYFSSLDECMITTRVSNLTYFNEIIWRCFKYWNTGCNGGRYSGARWTLNASKRNTLAILFKNIIYKKLICKNKMFIQGMASWSSASSELEKQMLPYWRVKKDRSL